MIKYICLISLSIISVGFYAQPGKAPPETKIRGLWVVRHSLTTPAKIDSLLVMAQRCLLTDLFVQVRGRGDAYYNSRYESKAPEIRPPDFDPLAYLLEHPLSARFRVHAWLNVFYIWSKDSLPRDQNHIVNRQSSWLAHSVRQKEFIRNYPHSVKAAQVEGLYVSPLQPDAQQHFLDIVQDLLNHYALDGIHLDYIRYPDQSFDIHPDVIKGFRTRYIIHPEQFLMHPESFAQKFSISGYEVFYHHWRRYLMNGLSDFVRRISVTVKAYSSRPILSAAVKPDVIDAHWNFYQDWDRWVKEGWLDWAIPMNYTGDSRIFHRRIDDYIGRLPANRYLVGISLYNQSPELAIRKIAQVVALQNAGFVLFAYDQLRAQGSLQRYLYQVGSTPVPREENK